MKYTLLLIILFPILGYSQVDTTCFENTHVQRIGNYIDSLERMTTMQGLVIQNQTIQISKYEILNKQNETLLAIRENEVTALNSALDFSLDINSKISMKEKWYESKYMYFIYGAITIYGGALVVSMVR